MNLNPNLIIFDLDGTLTPYKGTELYPEVVRYFKHYQVPGVEYAIATNQGGVGLRFMKKQANEDYEYLPTESDIWNRLYRVVNHLDNEYQTKVFPVVCFRYRTSEGEWSPMPKDTVNGSEWLRTWRKPAPGMLHHLMKIHNATPARTLFVGDRPEDQEAARAAGCQFQWAKDFFEYGS